jgi:hypothetical protein
MKIREDRDEERRGEGGEENIPNKTNFKSDLLTVSVFAIS